MGGPPRRAAGANLGHPCHQHQTSGRGCGARSHRAALESRPLPRRRRPRYRGSASSADQFLAVAAMQNKPSTQQDKASILTEPPDPELRQEEAPRHHLRRDPGLRRAQGDEALEEDDQQPPDRPPAPSGRRQEAGAHRCGARDRVAEGAQAASSTSSTSRRPALADRRGGRGVEDDDPGGAQDGAAAGRAARAPLGGRRSRRRASSGRALGHARRGHDAEEREAARDRRSETRRSRRSRRIGTSGRSSCSATTPGGCSARTRCKHPLWRACSQGGPPRRSGGTFCGTRSRRTS